jgi:hypothetical protein
MLRAEFGELASRVTGDSFIKDVSAWQPQYRTTNNVHMSERYVIKIYRNRLLFEAERHFYSVRRSFQFRVPEPIGFFELDHLEPVAIFYRVRGPTLLSLIPFRASFGRDILAQLIDNLVEFERLMETKRSEQQIWTYAASISPLCRRLEETGYPSAAEFLAFVASSADRAAAGLPRVPCFDLYPGNIILDSPKWDALLTHVDFDKADRRVPAGEQLSHLALVPGFRRELKRLLPKYSGAIGVNPASISANLRFATFFRACAGLRDAVLGAEHADSEPLHHAQRARTRSTMAKLAANSLAKLGRATSLSESESSEIVRALHAV